MYKNTTCNQAIVYKYSQSKSVNLQLDLPIHTCPSPCESPPLPSLSAESRTIDVLQRSNCQTARCAADTFLNSS